MPLSEHEQRLLDQIERALYAEDPKFASNVRGARMRSPSRRRRLQGIALFAMGLVLLVVGVMLPALRPAGIPVISVLGFLVMFGGAVLAIFARGHGQEAGPGAGLPGSAAPSGGSRSTLAQRMEERFRRRFEDR
ncbi:MAG TPA: DUF3040 domain-containing protein [Pseudonocardiaceae bacterium]|jgi:hypothetical protein|nr:DUF3040 domain-containing protein [Pseudonocardiaceae bacterium]